MSSETPSAGNEGKRPASAQQIPVSAPTERQADVYDVIAWFETNKKPLGLVALLLVIAGFALATWRYARQQKEEKAASALLELKPSVSTPTNMAPPSASSFLDVAQKYRGTDAAERAELFAASTIFTENKYPQAADAFASFLEKYPRSPFAPIAAYGRGAALEAQGKTNEAMAAYQSVTTGHPNTAAAEDARLALARIYEAQGQPEQALRVYNEMVPAGSMIPGSSQAYARREALFKEYPYLNTNKPITAVTTPVASSTNVAPPTLGTTRPTLSVSPTNAPPPQP